jgi:hypothetical protein
MIGVVSHDAGGAEVLSAFLSANQQKNVKYFLKGPAVKIFQKQGLIQKDYIYQGFLTEEFTYLFLSMSWRDNITYDMLYKSKELGIQSEVMLDSWYDYAQRFGSPKLGWESILPTYLTVVDDIAEKIVSKVGLDNYCKIKKVDNFYLKSLKQQYERLDVEEDDCNELLYLSAPLDVAKGAKIAELATTKTTQFDILKDISSICRKTNTKLRIRLHPSENKKSISKYLDMIDCKFVISDGESILNDFREAKFVLGYSSLALIQSSLLGKTSISYQKEDLKDLFNWNEYGVYGYYGINKVTSLKQIEKIISE